MRIPPSLKSEVTYARDIVKAGLDAASSAVKSGPENAPGPSLTSIGQSAIAPAALGAAIGLLSVYLGRKGRPGSAAFAGCLVGGIVGFTGGVAWATRQQTQLRYRAAAQNVQAVRDAHWLEKNPIAYA